MPKLSIITVNLNNATGLLKTIESVVNQTFTDYEYIVIDGGSTDGSKEIIEKYADKITYWLSEPDKGIYNAMNKGIKVARGEYVYFLNSGDTFFSNNILSFFIRKFDNFDFIYGNIKRYPSETIYDGKFNYQKLLYSNISHQAIFYKRTVLIELGMYNQKYIIGADYAINILIFTKGYPIKFVDKIIANYNENGISAYTFDEFFFYDIYKNFINPFEKIIDKEQIVKKTWDVFRLILLSGKLNKFRQLLFLIKISIYSKSIGGFYLGIKKMLK